MITDRRKIVAGNWKMNLLRPEALNLASALKQGLKDDSLYPEIIVFPPAVYVQELSELLHATPVAVGIQNVAQFDQGAYTGEISADMARSSGALYALVGHSERRTYFKEDAQALVLKLKACLNHQIIPVWCLGESLEDRKSTRHFDVVRSQLHDELFSLNAEEMMSVIVAYEPVWAIGTGLTASPEQAQEMHAFIRAEIAKNAGSTVADKIRILYGGSCNASNAANIFSQPDVDGGLIGGASLKPADFFTIIQKAHDQLLQH